jgi:hypothetical protein
MIHDVFEYGPGIPRYLGMWVVLTPVLVVALVRARVRPGAVLAVFLSTLPSLNRNPPSWFGFPLRWFVLIASSAYLVAWLVARVRAAPPTSSRNPPSEGGSARKSRWGVAALAALAALVGLTLALRTPLAWWDPGISQIGTSTERATHQLLDGRNPYPLPNPDADFGTYQYPAGTLLAHTPLVWAVPDTVAGEEHIGLRATLWLTDAAATALLTTAAGPLAGFVYAVHPTLVRESGLTVANDVLLALYVAAAAIALSRRRTLAAGVLAGLAISIKPAAVFAVPVLLAAVGWLPALVSVAVPALLQFPFLLWQSPGLHPFRGLLEPATRNEPLVVLRESTWYPLYRAVGHSDGLRSLIAFAGIAIAGIVALWAGRELRRRGMTLSRTAAALALPLLVSYALAGTPRTNYQDWYLTAFVVVVTLDRGGRGRRDYDSRSSQATLPPNSSGSSPGVSEQAAT